MVHHGALRRYAVVTRHADVREVLADRHAFTVARYAPTMEAITGPFILGLDDTPLYRHDDAALRAAVRPEDVERIDESMLAAARERVARGGELDVVGDLVDPCVHDVVSEYFGTFGPDTSTQVRWAKSIFRDIFLNIPTRAAVHQRALADAAEMRTHLDGLVARRKAALTAGEAVPEDLLTAMTPAAPTPTSTTRTAR